MKTTFVSWVMILLCLNAFSQRAEIIKIFDKYHIDPAPIDSLLSHSELQFNFDLITTIVTDGNKKIYKAQHNANKAGDSVWILQTVNDGSPSKTDRSTFTRQHDGKVPPLKADTNTYKLINDDGKTFIISFQYDEQSMINDNKFMKDCIVQLFFDVTTGKLLRSEGNISNSFKIKMFKANYLSSTATYQYDATIQRYLPLKEEVSVNMNLMGRSFDIITTNEYSNYQRP